MSETVMGATLHDLYQESMQERIIQKITQTSLKMLRECVNKPKESEPLKVYCSFNLALALFFYNIDHMFYHNYYDNFHYHINSQGYYGNPDVLTNDPVNSNGDIALNEYFPAFTLHQAKHFMQIKMDIDIIEKPIIVNKEKKYIADIWHKGKIIKHKQWSKTPFYDTSEEAFEEAALYILVLDEVNKCRLKKTSDPIKIGEKVWYGKKYTIYINDLDKYFRMLDIGQVLLTLDIYDLPKLIDEN